ncbi:MAG: MBL fold metallo-hydrolase [Gloeobacteraceae cyanobacterium ES-bin-316]|nr:MBL fold metallo-hydrolase [Ferruginibacter sp.]
MTKAYHLNCVEIVKPFYPVVCGHCLLVQDNGKLILVDTGIGLLDCLDPIGRIGQQMIDEVGYRFDESRTAVRQIEKMGLSPDLVTDCIISHLDNDHIGGLADFLNARVHMAAEEFANYDSGNPRYLKTPLLHHPAINTYERSDLRWFGFEARKINMNSNVEIFLIPLFGHTFGHCGVALKIHKKWIFYVADAYYMRVELTDINHPVSELAMAKADDNRSRITTLDKIRKLTNDHPEMEVFCYHDISEFDN